MNRKIRIILIIACVALLCGGLYLFYRYTQRPPQIVAASRSDWIHQAQKRLKSFNPSALKKGSEFEEFIDEEAYVVGNGDLIRAKDGGWVYFLMHSFHQDEARMAEKYGKDYYSETFKMSKEDKDAYIGNIVLAVDSDGHLYWCSSHPCLGIVIMPQNGKPFQTVQDFPSSRESIDDYRNPEGKTWQPLEWGEIPPLPPEVYMYAKRDRLIIQELKEHTIAEVRWFNMGTRHAMTFLKEKIEGLELPDGSSIEVTIPALKDTPFHDQTVRAYARDISVHEAATILARLPNIDFAVTNGTVAFTNRDASKLDDGNP